MRTEVFTAVDEDVLTEVEQDSDLFIANQQRIILYNDDVNTFDFVIDALVDVCEHEVVQAEQCAFIVHYKGKCDVKSGSFKELKPKCSELLRRGLTAEIE